MAEIKQTIRASRMLNKAYECCKGYRHEYIMPEHLLLALIEDYNFGGTPQGLFGGRGIVA